MSRFLDTLDPWPLGTPLPVQTQFMIMVDGLEYRITQSQLPSGDGGGATYSNVTRAQLLTLQIEEEFVPGTLYVVTGRGTGKPPVAVQAADGFRLSAYADQLEADGSVSAGSYDLADDEFTPGGLGGGATATVANVTETQYGIPAGPWTGTFNAFANALLSRFQYPGFSFYTLDNVGNVTLPVGTVVPAGTKTFRWGTSNSANVVANSIDITDETSGTVLAADTANDGQQVVSVAGFTVVKGTSRIYSISGLNTEGDLFAASITISGLFESFFGYSSQSTLTLAQLLALGNGQLQNGHARTVAGVTAGVGLYTVYTWEDNAGADDVATILQDGVDSIRGAFGVVRRETGPNAQGATVTMAYIVSNSTNAFTGSTLAFL